MISAQTRAQLKRLQIISKRLMKTSLAGDYLSAFRGSGMEFDQLREYTPGDDVRSIDWYSSLKTDKIMVKQLTEERDRTMILMIDVSASSRFSSQRQLKQDVVNELAAVLAFIASNNKDRVGALLFSDRVEKWIPPQRGRMHVSTMLEDIVTLKPEGRGTNIAEALRFLVGLKQGSAIVFMLSDFIDELSNMRSLLRVARLKYDCIALRVTDPCEQALPALIGLLDIEDIETGKLHTINTRDLSFFETERAQQKRIFEQQKIDVLNVTVGQPYLPVLIRFFHHRTRRSI